MPSLIAVKIADLLFEQHVGVKWAAVQIEPNLPDPNKPKNIVKPPKLPTPSKEVVTDPGKNKSSKMAPLPADSMTSSFVDYDSKLPAVSLPPAPTLR